jgi:hypothetical protein
MIYKKIERADFAIVADPAVVATGHYGAVGRLRRLKAKPSFVILRFDVSSRPSMRAV